MRCARLSHSSAAVALATVRTESAMQHYFRSQDRLLRKRFRFGYGAYADRILIGNKGGIDASQIDDHRRPNGTRYFGIEQAPSSATRSWRNAPGIGEKRNGGGCPGTARGGGRSRAPRLCCASATGRGRATTPRRGRSATPRLCFAATSSCRRPTTTRCGRCTTPSGRGCPAASTACHGHCGCAQCNGRIVSLTLSGTPHCPDSFTSISRVGEKPSLHARAADDGPQQG
jgi:hypothetical protein